jgi:hypothetical protein
LVSKSINCLNVLSRSNFRNDATINAVQIHLGRDTIRQNCSAVLPIAYLR